MSSAIVRSIGTPAVETAVEAAWAQWSAVTATAVPVEQRRVWTIVDPEALILLSLAVRDRERRLADLLAAWAREGSFLLSVQRLNTLAREYPQFVQDRIGDFAHQAAASDKRWQRYAKDPDEESPVARRKEIGPLHLAEGPMLMLRLRSGFGVGTKADLLTFLLGLHGAPADLKAITLATGYSDRAMRTAAEEMALAQFILQQPGPPSAYRADPRAWVGVLDGYQPDHGGEPQRSIPPWRFWSVVFAFLTSVIEWAEAAAQEEWSDYLASSRARDLMEAHQRRLQFVELRAAAPVGARGAAYLDDFGEFVDQVSTWTREHLHVMA